MIKTVGLLIFEVLTSLSVPAGAVFLGTVVDRVTLMDRDRAGPTDPVRPKPSRACNLGTTCPT